MKLFFREYGQVSQPVVLFLHGLLGCSDHWVGVARQLEQRGFRVIIPDLRNHGLSSHSDYMSYQIMADDVAALLQNLDIESCYAVGHSMGGKTAMALALRYPQLVTRLMVIDIAPRAYYGHEKFLRYINGMLEIDLGVANSRKDIEDKMRLIESRDSTLQFLMKNVGKKEKHFFWKPYLQGIGNNFDALSESLEGMGSYDKKTVFLKGARSKYIADGDDVLIRELFPNSDICVIQNAYHWVHVDAPDAFYEYLNNFLG